MNSESFSKYLIEDKREGELFKNALVFFDTSALLDFYYYSNSTAAEIFSKIFNGLKGRLVMAQQTEFEFLKNRSIVLQKPITSYDNLLKLDKFQKDSGHIDRIDEIIKTSQNLFGKELSGQFKTLKEKTTRADKHPFLDIKIYSEFDKKIQLLLKYMEGFENNFALFKQEIIEEIESKKESLAKELESDSILKQFQKSFTTTAELSHSEIIELIKEGEIRYRNEIPPGYLDKDEKIGFQKYGDLIIWKQILAHSKQKAKDVILIINDLKEDWWHYENKGRPTGPRHELIKEFNDFTGKEFWMYSTNDFLHKSKLYIDVNLKEQVIKDVGKLVKEWPEEEQMAIADWVFSYFDGTNLLDFNDEGKDAGIDYVAINSKNKKVAFQHKFTQKSRYTGLFIPLRDAYSKKDELKKNFAFDKLVYVLESKSLETANKLMQHIGRRNPQKILSGISDDFQILIAYRDEGIIKVMFDSDFNKPSDLEPSNWVKA